ncbi:hypothetical protein FOIG_08325 [Fusarium odoratissimum NRRL 54006]|uniref:Uncharacterized protein n=2 Tax=Fusarium oxysporum species complex TaxID=171631 RepID=X0KUF0_FUSO5|nr:uncharacterized protein FOIG_08325 [Fusarium odoratissimum NRRL 54006]EXM00370.1 hypothetical protein FOIG_08325 [Fusarium odoratissimum NRRL 54006]TXC12016.1 hypothetical protein FocTR4_00006704 [Fusarium oxysporum f. sp. cubense]
MLLMGTSAYYRILSTSAAMIKSPVPRMFCAATAAVTNFRRRCRASTSALLLRAAAPHYHPRKSHYDHASSMKTENRLHSLNTHKRDKVVLCMEESVLAAIPLVTILAQGVAQQTASGISSKARLICRIGILTSHAIQQKRVTQLYCNRVSLYACYNLPKLGA